MPNDITTLAIEIQSQEAERNLRTFQELLTLSSQTAHKMEKVSIEVNAEQAISQLQTMREVYEGIAAAGKNIAFEMPKMPEITAVPEMSMQSDPEALRALQEFFETSREMSQSLREEMEQFSEAMRKVEADTEKVSTAGGRSIGTMRGGMAVSREYAMAVRELNAAQREMEKAIVQADEAMKATAAADEDAAAVKKRLTQAQRELASVSKQLADTHNGMGGDIIGLSQKEDMLKNKVAELKIVYEEAKGAAEKFNLKLEESAAKADMASAKYRELKSKVELMPKPVGNTTESIQTFSEKAKLAGRDITKLTRGISGIASVAGTAIPGISGLGRAISMLGMGNPYLAAAAVAVGACVAVYHEYDKVMQDTAVSAHEMAEAQAKAASAFKKEAEDRQGDLDRLAVLNSYQSLYDVEKEESRKIVEKLTSAYKDLGIQYDAITGKVSNLAEVTKRLSEQDRKRVLEEQKDAVKRAQEAAETQLAESQRNSVSWFKNVLTMDYPGGRLPGRGKTAKQQADEWYAYINSAEDVEEKIKRIDEAISKLHNVRRKGSWGQRFLLDAENFSNQLNKSRTALLEYQKQIKILNGIQDRNGVGGRSEKEISKSLQAREEKLRAARFAGMSVQEKNSYNEEKIENLIKKRQEIAAKNSRDAVVYNGENITAAEALLTIDTEIRNRIQDRLKYKKQLDALEEKSEQRKQRQSERTKRETEALKARLETIRDTYVLDSKGNAIRRKNSIEQAEMRSKKIQELKGKIDTLLKTTPALRRDATEEDLITWGRRFNPATGKMDGAQKQAGWRGVLPDGNGGVMTEVGVGTKINGKEVEIPLIVPESTEEDLKRIAKIANGKLTDIPDDLMEKAIAFAQKRIAAGKSPFFNGDKRDERLRRITTSDSIERDLLKYQSKLYGLQGEQIKSKEASKREQEQVEAIKRPFVYDKKGNIIREKSEKELAETRKQEIAALQKKLKNELNVGTPEYYKAQKELERLKQEEFRERQKSSFSNVGFSQMQAHNSMVQGIEAKSSQALRLESRNFNKPDNLWKSLEKIQTKIYDHLNDFKPNIATIADGIGAISGNVTPL